MFLSCLGLTGASSLDPVAPYEPGGDKKNAPWVKTLWAWYETSALAGRRGKDRARPEAAGSEARPRASGARPWRGNRPGRRASARARSVELPKALSLFGWGRMIAAGNLPAVLTRKFARSTS